MDSRGGPIGRRHPPKKPCLDRARNELARAATQIRSGHWRSAVYLHRIRKHPNDRCWFCSTYSKMSRSHTLLHCPNPRLSAARTEAWGANKPTGVRALLSNPRWERRLLIFLERSGVGRVVAGGRDPDAAWANKRDRWVIWEGSRDPGNLVLIFLSFLLQLARGLTPETAHSAPLRSVDFLESRPLGGPQGAPFFDGRVFLLGYISPRDEWPLNEIK